ncbi:MAG: hypothetical protein IT262_13285 [Saprospiraceae bacterium]|nr:hypothetical protein [Saprospiraceae bacterium]
MRTKLFFFTLLMFSAIISCQKEGFKQIESSEKLLVSQNPFNYVGLLHNEGLDAIRQKYFSDVKGKGGLNENFVTYRDESLDYEAIDDATVDYFVTVTQASLFPSTNIPLLKANTYDFINNNVAPYYNQCTNLSCLTDLDQVLATTSLGSSARSILKELVYEVSNSGDNLTSWLNIITRYESATTASSLSAQEKDILLISYAVYRSSLQYWYNVYVYGATPWTSGLQPRSSTSVAKDIASADLAGAVVGAVGGIYTGVTSGALVFGPGGVVATAVGGAVITGARASAVAGLGKLIRSWW